MKTLRYFSVCCLLTSLVLFSSCKKDDNRSFYFSKLMLLGTWSWVSTDGGIGPMHQTPASTGNNIDLKFTIDNHYYFYMNGTLSEQGTYTLGISSWRIPNKMVILFSSQGGLEYLIERLDSSNLEISMNAADGTWSVYTKK